MKSDDIKKTLLEPKSFVKLDIIVKSGITELDVLLGGFKAGEITYVDGNSKLISNLPNQLCVNTYTTFKSPTIYIDGGICADPYRIAKYARMNEIDQNDVLNQVHISRAFTVYQLSSFIDHLLEKEIKKHDPRTLIIGKFPALFLDSDIPTQETQIILKNTIIKLHELTSSYNLITVLTNVDSRMYSNKIRNTIQSYVHETVRMKYIEPCTYVDLLRKKENTTVLHLTEGQLRLEHFGMVM